MFEIVSFNWIGGNTTNQLLPPLFMENEERTNFLISSISKEEKELNGFIEGNVKVVKNEKKETFILLEEIFQGTVSAKEALKNSIILELSGKWSTTIQKIINPNVKSFKF
jgi:hypothetical protein